MLKNKSAKLLLWVAIAGISMFFAGLTSAYIVRKAEGNWITFQLPDWFLFSTIVIVFSSISIIIAKRIVKQNKSATSWLFTTLLLGSFFAFFQLKGWELLVEQGLYMTGEGSNISASFLYVITLAHLVHLIGGLIALLITAINTKRGKYTNKDCLGFELTTIYWHFLGLLWVYLFFFLKYF